MLEPMQNAGVGSLSKHYASAVKASREPSNGNTSGRGRRPRAAKPKPGRPTAARVEEINRAILDAARKAFRTTRYEGIRMEAIAARAGISKPTLYARYPTKEALFTAVAADRVSQWARESAPDQGPLPADLRLRLKHRARKHMEYFETGQIENLERLLASAPLSPELRRLRHKVGHQSVVQVIAHDIIDSTPDEHVPRETALQIAEMLVILLYGWWRAQIDVRRVTSEEAQAFADHAVDVLLDGRAKWVRARSPKVVKFSPK